MWTRQTFLFFIFYLKKKNKQILLWPFWGFRRFRRNWTPHVRPIQKQFTAVMLCIFPLRSPLPSLSLSLAQYVDREKDIDRWKHRLFLSVSVNEKGVEKCLTISQPFQFWFYSYPNCSFPLLIYRKMNNNESHFLESKWRERVEKYL